MHFHIHADGSDFIVSDPYDAKEGSTILSYSRSSGGNSDSGSGFGTDPGSEDENLALCFNVTILGDSIVEDNLEYIHLQVDFGDIFVDNITLIILDDDSKSL